MIIHLIYFNCYILIPRIYLITSDGSSNNNHHCFIFDLSGNVCGVLLLNRKLIDIASFYYIRNAFLPTYFFFSVGYSQVLERLSYFSFLMIYFIKESTNKIVYVYRVQRDVL